MATTRHRTTLNVHNSIQHNSKRHKSTRHNSTRHNATRHNSTRPQLDTPQLYTPQLYTDHMAVRLNLLYSRAGRRFYRIQLYTVITLHTQLNTAHFYMATTRHRTTLNVHNSIQHNSTRHNLTRHNSTRHNSTPHNSTRPQLDIPQFYTASTRHATTLHRPHGRTIESTIQQGRPSFLQDTTLNSHNSIHTTQHGTFLYGHNPTPHNSKRPQLYTSTTRHTTTLHGHNSTRHNSTQTTWPYD